MTRRVGTRPARSTPAMRDILVAPPPDVWNDGLTRATTSRVAIDSAVTSSRPRKRRALPSAPKIEQPFAAHGLPLWCIDPLTGEVMMPSASGIALGTYFSDHGLTAPGDAGAVDSWRAQMGRLPAVWMIYQWWTGWNQFPVHQAQRASAMGGSFLVTWEPWGGNLYDSKWNCRAIARGGSDAYIRKYARAVKSSGVPVMIRLGHEMNGDWYPWGIANTPSGRHNGNSPAHFVAMWRRVVNLFRQEGALNVSWVWAPNIFYMNERNSRQNQIKDLRALYPGDDYVGWIGLSVYNDGARRAWKSFQTLFGDSYATLAGMSKKPMMIAEIGVTEEGAPRGESKADWITQTFLDDIPTRFPRVKLVNYFSRDRRMFGESNYRLDSSPASLTAFRRVVNSPLYQGRIETD